MEPIRKKFKIEVPPDLKEVSDLYKSAGFDIYLVGGAVRDSILRKTPKDFDLATNASPDDGLKILSQDPSIQVDKVGKAFGVLLTRTKNGNEYEIATFRKDIGKGRRPDQVEFTSIEEDVKRRDLTINALFYDLSSGEIVDYVGGIQDIIDGNIRSVGDPAERFDEDRLRILRAVRFAGRFGSNLDSKTFQAIKNDPDLSGVSNERIRDEFLNGLRTSKSYRHYLDLIENLNLWPQIFPTLKVRTDILGSNNPIILLTLFLRDNDIKKLQISLKNLKYSTKEIDLISFLLSLRGVTPETAPMLKKEYKRTKILPEEIREYFALSGEMKGTKVDEIINYFESDHGINARDLMSKGLKGAEIGREMSTAEMDLFRQLVHEVFLGPATGVNYTGIILDNISQDKIKKFVPKGWKSFCHHVTLVPPDEMAWRLPSRWLGADQNFRMIGLAKNDKVIAGLITFDGEPIPMKIVGLPHVTIATNPVTGGKPAMSNEFKEEDFEIIDPIYLKGKIQEVMNENNNESLLRDLIKEIVHQEMINEFVVPMGFGLARWKKYKKKHGITNSEYRRRHPKKKWKVVHGHKEGEIGKPLKGMTNMSYSKANQAHRAIVTSQ